MSNKKLYITVLLWTIISVFILQSLINLYVYILYSFQMHEILKFHDYDKYPKLALVIYKFQFIHFCNPLITLILIALSKRDKYVGKRKIIFFFMNLIIHMFWIFLCGLVILLLYIKKMPMAT